MQIYPVEPGFITNQSFTLGVEPGNTFGIGVYFQEGGDSLTCLGRCALTATSGSVVDKGWMTNYRCFQSTGSLGPRFYGTDWGWPTVSMKLSRRLPPSGVYVAVAFPTDQMGIPTNDLGRAVRDGLPLTATPPNSDSMALLVGSPPAPTPGAKIAYILPIATYHAYNGRGGGAFYGWDFLDPPVAEVTQVTMRRPGGGLGAYSGEPKDLYDTASPRQQFAHWDAKMIRWLLREQTSGTLPAADFYTDLNLHGNTVPSSYRVIVSGGHHEYWSQDMRSNLNSFLAAGGNYACFSGNTCFRPISFGAWHTSGFRTSVVKISNQWPAGNKENALIGLSWSYGGGHWGTYDKKKKEWVETARPAYGLKVQPGKSGHWAFAGTGLGEGATIGGSADFLVGYEADGVAPGDTSVTLLAQSPELTGFQDGAHGKGAMIIKNDPGSGRASGSVFNVGTTDWARILMNGSAESHTVVSEITSTVLRKYTAS